VHPDTGISSKAMSIMCVLSPRAAALHHASLAAADASPHPAPQELVHQRHLREDRHRGRQAGALQQEADGDQPRDPDRGAPHPAGRAGQARRVGGHQGRDQVHLLVNAPWRSRRATPRAQTTHHTWCYLTPPTPPRVQCPRSRNSSACLGRMSLHARGWVRGLCCRRWRMAARLPSREPRCRSPRPLGVHAELHSVRLHHQACVSSMQAVGA